MLKVFNRIEIDDYFLFMIESQNFSSCGNIKNFSITWLTDKDALSLLLFYTGMEVLANTIRQEKVIRRIKIGKEEAKLSVGDIILHICKFQRTSKKPP